MFRTLYDDLWTKRGGGGGCGSGSGQEEMEEVHGRLTPQTTGAGV